MPKYYLDVDVNTVATQRIEQLFDIFPKTYLAFSGGKDSTVMLHIALDIARQKGCLPLDVLFIDLEGQYSLTIDHINEMTLNNDDINLHWVCLPLNLRNSISVFQPHWRCWDPEEKDKWIRPMPDNDSVISDYNYYPFYKYGMEFEEFVFEWGNWFSNGQLCSCLLGIRADESLNRFISVSTKPWNDLNWMSRASKNLVYSYPIYDWRTEDIWRYVGKNKVSYNKLYDKFYLCGLTIHQARICQPYGDDQRQSLEYFHIIEPELWDRVILRVSGVNFGSIYSKTAILGRRKVVLPNGLTWKQYVNLLLESMPVITRSHYEKKIRTFVSWWNNHGFPFDLIPDESNLKLENAGKVPSWRRIAKCIVKNDWWCRSIGFCQTKKTYDELYSKRIN